MKSFGLALWADDAVSIMYAQPAGPIRTRFVRSSGACYRLPCRTNPKFASVMPRTQPQSPLQFHPKRASASGLECLSINVCRRPRGVEQDHRWWALAFSLPVRISIHGDPDQRPARTRRGQKKDSDGGNRPASRLRLRSPDATRMLSRRDHSPHQANADRDEEVHKRIPGSAKITTGWPFPYLTTPRTPSLPA